MKRASTSAVKNHWLHCVSSPQWTLYYAHAKRGLEAMNSQPLLALFTGYWCMIIGRIFAPAKSAFPPSLAVKPYFKLDCLHALCNAHHLRELTFAYEQEGQMWAKHMLDLLAAILADVHTQGGALTVEQAADYREQYRAVLIQAVKECPLPPEPEGAKRRRGRIKRSKSRNLLQRLRNYEQETLRFMTDIDVPFTNNQGENDIRMTKLHQKISGCFRSQEGADFFCRIRSYLSTCRKHDVSATTALPLLFEGKLPDFIL